MSWFPDEMQTETALDGAVCDEHAQPGILIERRAVLSLLPAGLAAFLIGDSRAAVAAIQEVVAQEGAAEFDPERGLSMEQLLDQIAPLALELHRSERRHEDAYLYHLASTLLHLDEEGLRPMEVSEREIAFSRSGGRRLAEGRTPSISVMQIRMKPGAAIPWHDHRGYNGVILGLEGSVRCRNYDLVPAGNAGTEEPERVKIRETSDLNLQRGRISTLSTRRDNIHDLRTGEQGGCVLDVFTHLQPRSGSHYLEVNEEPVDVDERIYEARWR